MDKKELYVIFGPPGSGKTAQAKYIAKTLGFQNISWGEIYRDKELRENYNREFETIDADETNDQLRSKMISKIINSQIEQVGGDIKGIVIDGYPRRIEEAKLLEKLVEKHNLQIKALIRINPSIQKAFERLNKRFICPVCSRYYDGELSPPRRSGVCDYDDAKLEVKKKTRTIIEKSFYLYMKENGPAFKYLKKISDTYFDVSGEDDDIVVFFKHTSKD